MTKYIVTLYYKPKEMIELEDSLNQFLAPFYISDKIIIEHSIKLYELNVNVKLTEQHLCKIKSIIEEVMNLKSTIGSNYRIEITEGYTDEIKP